MLDLLIINARIIDGTGAPWFTGAVGVADGRVAVILEAGTVAAREIWDAGGRYLAPGFIDVHTHDDVAMLREGGRIEKAAQGVTTIVTGNCSFSCYPSPEPTKTRLAEHLGSLLGPVPDKEIFPDFARYRDALHQAGLGPNVVSLVGHGAIRLAVMGYDPRKASAEEMSEMEQLLDTQLSQGAAGLSLGLVYPPSAWATDEELVGLSRVVARRGGVLAAHMRSYDYEIESAMEEFLALLAASGAKGLLSHLQVCGRENWGKMPDLLERLEQARRDGIDVSCDMYPYTAGASTILQLLPPSAQAGGNDAVIARLADPVTREAIRDAVASPVTPGATWHSKATQIGWENLRVGGVNVESHKRYEGRSLLEIATEEDRDPFDVTAELITCDCCQTNIIMFQQSEDDLRLVLNHRLHMTGSDSIPRAGGKPHPRAAGSFARILARHAMAESQVSIEEAVRRMTSFPAQRFALHDRGLIRPGMVADLVLFESEVRDQATYDEPRLPPVGITAVFVAGQALVKDGLHTGARPGRVI